IDARVFSRKGVSKDERATRIEEEQRRKLDKDRVDELRIIRTSAKSQILGLLGDRATQTRITDDTRHVLLAKDSVVTAEVLEELPTQYWGELNVGDPKVEE